MDLGLRGKRALVTGASKGIGAAVAELLAEEGAHVRLVARSAPALDELATRLSSTYDVECVAVPADLRNAEDIDRVAQVAAGIDILVNNAGDIPGGPLDLIDEATWRRAWELKVFGYINLTRLIYPQMQAHGGGAIINVIGVGGELFDYDYITGATGNAALMAFTRAMGGRSLRDGIRVVGLNPGAVETDRMVSMLQARAVRSFGDATRWRELTQRYPMGRGATPREIADSVVFLASERSSYTTGVILSVDGGHVAGRS